MSFGRFSRTACLAGLAAWAISTAQAQTYWLDSRYDSAETYYPIAEEACITGELQRRLDNRIRTSTQPHRYTSIYIGPDYDIGERVCRGVIQRRLGSFWITAEMVDTIVYGPLGTVPECPLSGLPDPDTAQCGVPKCDSDCPAGGGNPSNPIASATGNKRQREVDYSGAGIFPLTFVRTYNSHRVADNQALPVCQ